MKTISPALQSHLGAEVTTLATLWKVTRRDGQVFGFTDNDRDISFGGTLYAARTGFTASAIQSSSAMNVDSVDIDGAFDSSVITTADMEAGVWDGAAVRVSVVNYADVSQGEMVQRVGVLGNFAARGNVFVAELRGLMDRLQKQISRQYLPVCNAALGDARCGLSLASYTFSATVTAVTDSANFTASSLAQAANYFTAGLLTWTGGANNGRKMEVKTHTGGGALVLSLPMPGAVIVGDTFSVIAGDDKRIETCRDKFNNVVNFRGFPYIPGLDKALRAGGQ